VGCDAMKDSKVKSIFVFIAGFGMILIIVTATLWTIGEGKY